MSSQLQFMLQTEYGKSIALIVIVGLVLISMVGWGLKYRNLGEKLSEHGMKISLYIIVAFIALQLLGDGAGSFHDGSIEEESVPFEIRFSKGVSFTVGLLLALITLILMCKEFDMCVKGSDRVRSSMPQIPFMNFGKALGFGRRRKKRRC